MLVPCDSLQSKLRVQARNSLERYCLRLKKIISGKLGHKLYRRDKSKVGNMLRIVFMFRPGNAPWFNVFSAVPFNVEWL